VKSLIEVGATSSNVSRKMMITTMVRTSTVTRVALTKTDATTTQACWSLYRKPCARSEHGIVPRLIDVPASRAALAVVLAHDAAMAFAAQPAVDADDLDLDADRALQHAGPNNARYANGCQQTRGW